MGVISPTISNSDKEKLLRLYARLGLAAHGVVYCLMSILTLFTAFGLSNNKTEKSEAFRFIHEQPFGKVIIFIIGICMLGYVLLRFFQAFRDTRKKGKKLKGIALRIGYAFIAIGYLSLSIFCFKMVFDRSDEGNSHREYAKTLLYFPAGAWMVGGVAVGFAAAAVYQVVRGVGKKFMKTVALYHSEYKDTFSRIGTIGYVARGIVFSIIAYLFMRAAIQANSNEAGGTNDAFSFLQKNFGNLLMALMALGLMAFGVFMFVRAKHEKMDFGMNSDSS
jgi:hypothetical protein